MKIYKIVVTGGPCAGKTKLMSALKNKPVPDGYQLFFIPEIATELMESGLSYKQNRVEFQKAALHLQLEKEKIIENYINNVCSSDATCVIICDRGALDGRAYCSSEEWAAITKAESVYAHHLINRYDAIIHLDTAALLEDPSFYTNKSNLHRSETRAEAILLNLAVKMAYDFYDIIHVVISPHNTFEEKEKRFFDALAGILTTLSQQ